MKVLGLIAAALGLAVVAFAAWVRLAPLDAAALHVDPLAATGGAMSGWLAAPGGDAELVTLALPPDEAAARVAEVILATPRTTLLAGGDGFATYVTRSAVWGFPDITSVRISAAGDGSAVAIYGRAQVGRSDMGVNRARIEGWRAALAP